MGCEQCQTGAERRWENKSKGTEDELKELNHSCDCCLRGLSTLSKHIRRCMWHPPLTPIHIAARPALFISPVLISGACNENADQKFECDKCTTVSPTQSFFRVLLEFWPNFGGCVFTFGWLVTLNVSWMCVCLCALSRICSWLDLPNRLWPLLGISSSKKKKNCARLRF